MNGTRIVIADSDNSFRKNLKGILTRSGYTVAGEAEDGLSALKLVRSREPELVILDSKLPVKDGLEVAKIIEDDKLAPVLLLAHYSQQELLTKARDYMISAFMVKPIDEMHLIPTIELAIANYEKVSKLQKQVQELKETLESRKVVERAKGILMETLGLPEKEAFKRIQKQSMNKRTSMKAIADAIIVAHELSK